MITLTDDYYLFIYSEWDSKVLTSDFIERFLIDYSYSSLTKKWKKTRKYNLYWICPRGLTTVLDLSLWHYWSLALKDFCLLKGSEVNALSQVWKFDEELSVMFQKPIEKVMNRNKEIFSLMRQNKL